VRYVSNSFIISINKNAKKVIYMLQLLNTK